MNKEEGNIKRFGDYAKTDMVAETTTIINVGSRPYVIAILLCWVFRKDMYIRVGKDYDNSILYAEVKCGPFPEGE